MATDYLDELIGAVKQSAQTAKKDEEEGLAKPINIESASQQSTILAAQRVTSEAPVQAAQTITIQQETPIEPEAKKPEDREEELAKEIHPNDMRAVEKDYDEQAAVDKTAIEKELEANKKTEVKAYGKVKIYRIHGKPLAYYFVPTTKPTSSERRMINTLKEATTRLISISPYKVRDPEERRVVYKQKVIEIIRTNTNLKIPESRQNFYADAVVREMVGYGLIDDLIKDDNLEEIMIVGPKRPVYVFHREYEMMLTNIEFFSEQEIEDLINKIAREVGRRVDVSSPLLDARLTDGSRVNATIPPASISGGTITIRKFRKDPYSIIDLIRMNTISSEAAAFLWLAIDGMGTKPANILISGGTGSGKTTLLNVLASFVPDRERVITIEDTAELNLPIKHWIRLESRPPGIEGTGELKMDILTKNSLRMRPDRIIVGEIRHEEAFTLFTALNTGHDGALSADALITLANGEIRSISAIAEELFANKKPIIEKDHEFVDVTNGPSVPSLNKQTLKIENKPIVRAWRKKYPGNLTKIRLRSGKNISLTNDHPIYRIYNGIQEISAGDARLGDWIAIPNAVAAEGEAEKPHMHLAGLIYGDGHISKEHIEFVNGEADLAKTFASYAHQITVNKVKEKFDGTYTRVKFCDAKMVRHFNTEYRIPIGKKTKIFTLEKEILSSTGENLALFLQGLYDCEAHVNLYSNSLQFATSNPDLAQKLPIILQRYGIHSSTYIQEKDGKGHTGPYYRNSIYGNENITAFSRHIGFSHPKKQAALVRLCEKSRNSIDVFPNLCRIIRDARTEVGITQVEVGKLLGNTTSSVPRAYEAGDRAPTRTTLAKLAAVLKTNSAKQLKMLAESGLKFENIVSIEQTPYDGYVYDFTVEANHNYVANDILVSNCLGTVHANSPEETLIRVMSPPMNVPSIMMTGLDLIVVEHRYYDRKKGTIRRISEIAEVYGAMEGTPKTQTLYQRDSVNDRLEKTLIESKYLKSLQNFTGQSKDRVIAELESRKNFFNSLVQKNIRDLSNVSESAKKYVEEKNTMV